MEILIPVITLGVLGLVFGIGLALASKKLVTVADPRLERIQGLLPGSNCGACGGAGCFGFAESILSGKLGIDACRVSNEQTKEKIAQFLGKKLEKRVKLVAAVHCNGGTKVKDRVLYQGIEDCVSANLVAAGHKECLWGCLGFGTCAKVCPFGAITMSKEQLPVVLPLQCKACNKCVLVCPKKLISLIPVARDIYVACSSCDTGKDTRAVCPVGCIACGICARVKDSPFYLKENLSSIDYKKAAHKEPFEEAKNKCPTKCILKIVSSTKE